MAWVPPCQCPRRADARRPLHACTRLARLVGGRLVDLCWPGPATPARLVVSSNLCRWNHQESLHPCPCNGSITSFRSLAFSLLLMSAHGWNSIIGGKSGPTRWQWYDTNTNTNTPRLATVRTNQLVPDVERPFASMHARTLSLLLTSKGQR